MAESLAAMTPDGDGLTRPISAPGGPDRSGQRHGSAHYRSRRSYGDGVGVADDGDGLPSPGERHVEVVHVRGPLAVVDDDLVVLQALDQQRPRHDPAAVPSALAPEPGSDEPRGGKKGGR